MIGMPNFDCGTAQERVERGIKYIEGNYRGDLPWYEKINTDVLDIEDSDWCIAGQLWGSYVYALPKTGIGERINMGFSTMIPHSQVAPLQNEWKRQISQLQAKAKSS